MSSKKEQKGDKWGRRKENKNHPERTDDTSLNEEPPKEMETRETSKRKKDKQANRSNSKRWQDESRRASPSESNNADDTDSSQENTSHPLDDRRSVGKPNDRVPDKSSGSKKEENRRASYRTTTTSKPNWPGLIETYPDYIFRFGEHGDYLVIKGLRNLHNTCYMASAVQLLLASGIVSDKKEPTDRKEPRALTILKDLHNGRSDWSESAKKLTKLLPNFTTYKQEDALDFMRGVYMLETCEVMKRYFFMSTEQTTICGNCKHESPNGPKLFPEIAVYPTKEEGERLMQTRLEEFLHSKHIEGGRCKRCTSSSEKNLFIDNKVIRAPEVITIRIVRWNPGDVTKNLYPVTIEDDLLLDDKFGYYLVGILTHLGPTVKGGHYLCDVKLKNQWLRCDDRSVRRIGDRRDPVGYKNANSLVCGALYKRYLKLEEDMRNAKLQSTPRSTTRGEVAPVSHGRDKKPPIDRSTKPPDGSVSTNETEPVTKSDTITPKEEDNGNKGVLPGMKKLSISRLDAHQGTKTYSEDVHKKTADYVRPRDEFEMKFHASFAKQILELVANTQMWEVETLSFLKFWADSQDDVIWRSFWANVKSQLDSETSSNDAGRLKNPNVLDIFGALCSDKSNRVFFTKTQGELRCSNSCWTMPVGTFEISEISITDDSLKKKRTWGLSHLIWWELNEKGNLPMSCDHCSRSKEKGEVTLKQSVIEASEIIVIRFDENSRNPFQATIPEEVTIHKTEYQLVGVVLAEKIKKGSTISYERYEFDIKQNDKWTRKTVYSENPMGRIRKESSGQVRGAFFQKNGMQRESNPHYPDSSTI